MKTLIEIEHGETTCAVEPGRFCRFVRVSHWGKAYSCALYEENLCDDGGWLMRCEACLAREAEEGK